MRAPIKTAVVFAIIFASMLLSPVSAVDADQKVSEFTEYYCNDYNLSFIYTGGTADTNGLSVSWSAKGYDEGGNLVAESPYVPERDLPELINEDSFTSANGWKVTFIAESVKMCDFVLVKQYVKDNSMELPLTGMIKVNVIEPPKDGDSFKVRFFDGYTGAVYDTKHIKTSTYVEVGQSFVELPKTPVRQGYSFVGWFIDPEKNVRFDSTKPIESDVDVYAKWSYSGGHNPGPGPWDPEQPDNPGGGDDPWNPGDDANPDNQGGSGSGGQDSKMFFVVFPLVVIIIMLVACIVMLQLRRGS